MLDELTGVSSYFVEHYEECKDMDKMTYKRKSGEYDIHKQSLSINTLINKMIENKLLRPMTDDELIYVISNFKLEDNINYNRKRLVDVPDVEIIRAEVSASLAQQHSCAGKHNPYCVKPKQTKFFFGYKPEPEEIDDRLRELQEVIDSLPLRHHIDVSNYYRYSNLMQKIMFEYGCFDGVYESSGYDNQQLRKSIKYPRPHSDYKCGKCFEICEKLYYIDMNSSYMSFINLGNNFSKFASISTNLICSFS